MTSATLYREGDDLDALLASIDAEHPGRVHVVSVTYPRAGGVFGFFARQRVAVEYELSDEPMVDAPALDNHPLAALIDAADAAEAARSPRPAPQVDTLLSHRPDSASNEEFAKMLLDLAARKSAPEPDPVEVPALPPAAQPAARPVVPESNRNRLTLRRRLAEIGVPIGWMPDEPAETYGVVEQLVTRLPAAPEPPTGAGDVFVIVGPAAPALRTAETMRKRMHLPPENVWAAGCPADAIPAERTITDAWQAATVAADVRLGGRGPTIVVVALDDESDEIGPERWAARLVKALGPEALWVVVDAMQKPSDTRALLRVVGTPTALVVTGAARTASPASVWELDAPVALLDGRPATRGAWAVLLIDKLAALDD